MYQKKHSPIKVMSNSLSVGLNVVLLLVFLFVLMLRDNIFVSAPVRLPWICTLRFLVPGPPLIINVNKNEVTLQLPEGIITRDSTLMYMQGVYKMHFKDSVKEDIETKGIIDAPLAKLKEPSVGSLSSEAALVRRSIPFGSSDSELKRWIFGARLADREVNGRALLIAVRTDTNANPYLLQRIKAILRDQKIVKYDLITSPKDSVITTAASVLRD